MGPGGHFGIPFLVPKAVPKTVSKRESRGPVWGTILGTKKQYQKCPPNWLLKGNQKETPLFGTSFWDHLWHQKLYPKLPVWGHFWRAFLLPLLAPQLVPRNCPLGGFLGRRCDQKKVPKSAPKKGVVLAHILRQKMQPNVILKVAPGMQLAGRKAATKGFLISAKGFQGQRGLPRNRSQRALIQDVLRGLRFGALPHPGSRLPTPRRSRAGCFHHPCGEARQ